MICKQGRRGQGGRGGHGPPCFKNRPLFGNFKVPSENVAVGKDR